MATLLAAPTLRLRTGPSAGQTYEVRNALRIGRHPYNEVSLPDLSVSRYHCWITIQDGAIFIEDLASANGTYVNGERAVSRHPLKPGTVVRVGQTEFTFTEGEREGAGGLAQSLGSSYVRWVSESAQERG